MPEEDLENPFQYEWKLISSPSSEHATAQENTKTLELSGLTQGVYVWKVAVTAMEPPGYGEFKANVTVLSAKRINSPPKAAIVPAIQIVNLPTNKAVFGGEPSTDDSGKIASYLWALDSGPVAYQPILPSLPYITLTNLIAGNYSIRLMVTDEDGASDITTATLVVVPETDYKPTPTATTLTTPATPSIATTPPITATPTTIMERTATMEATTTTMMEKTTAVGGNDEVDGGLETGSLDILEVALGAIALVLFASIALAWVLCKRSVLVIVVQMIISFWLSA